MGGGVLSRCRGQQEVVIRDAGGRTGGRAETEGLIGFFVNTGGVALWI